MIHVCSMFFFFSSRRRHTRCSRDWSSDVCSSDLVQVEPFEREFSQSQQIEGNGAGSGGNNQMEISRRQKELIAATWKQQNDKMSSPKEASAAGQFLSDAQRKLRDQVMALSVRMQSRDLSQANEEFSDFNFDFSERGLGAQQCLERLLLPLHHNPPLRLSEAFPRMQHTPTPI